MFPGPAIDSLGALGGLKALVRFCSGRSLAGSSRSKVADPSGVADRRAGRYPRGDMTCVNTFEKLVIAVVLGVGACGGDKGDTGDTGGSESTSGTSDSTIGMSSNPTTGGETGTGGATEGTTTTVEMTGGEVTADITGEPTSASDTATDGPPGVCQTLCDNATACGLDLGGPNCVAECMGETMSDDPKCAAASQAVLECFAGLSCEELAAAVNDEEFGPCTDEIQAQGEACSDGVCGGGTGIHEGEMSCEWSRECEGEPTVLMTCDEVACTCFVDDVKTGSCDAEGVCQDFDALEAKLQSCCGG